MRNPPVSDIMYAAQNLEINEALVWVAPEHYENLIRPIALETNGPQRAPAFHLEDLEPPVQHPLTDDDKHFTRKHGTLAATRIATPEDGSPWVIRLALQHNEREPTRHQWDYLRAFFCTLPVPVDVIRPATGSTPQPMADLDLLLHRRDPLIAGRSLVSCLTSSHKSYSSHRLVQGFHCALESGAGSLDLESLCHYMDEHPLQPHKGWLRLGPRLRESLRVDSLREASLSSQRTQSLEDLVQMEAWRGLSGPGTRVRIIETAENLVQSCVSLARASALRSEVTAPQATVSRPRRRI
ncbi:MULTISPECIES: hypothetical protein [unclassified Thioalkalivibrio]|uniref:hypothetical protein n=1 Tax=unclassified Thioalkalivibrio TaxID=2621013 RepID=UPI0003786CCB|nr:MULTISPECIES: hypothetical protein [unclassified Thioalkalivibrio]